MSIFFKGTNIPEFTLFGIKRDFDKSNVAVNDVIEFIKKTEKYNYDGILLPESNNGPIHPWVFAQLLFTASETLRPFIAINPVYAHPFFVAKQIANLIEFYKRPLFINYITGTAKTDGISLNDTIERSEKYERLIEYVTIVNKLVAGKEESLNFNGRYFKIEDASLRIKLEKSQLPVNHIAGSSENCLKAINETASSRLAMAMPISHLQKLNETRNYPMGLHFGIITRKTKKEALTVLNTFSPPDKSKQISQHIATRSAGVTWKNRMLERLKEIKDTDVYNLVPFKNFNSDVPYLVGSYEEVSSYLEAYLDQGITLLVYEIPITGENEFRHISELRKLLTVNKISA
jgi:alkanesulfonate monooxygenase